MCREENYLQFELLRHPEIKMKETRTELSYRNFSYKTKQNRPEQERLFVEKTPCQEPFLESYGKRAQYEFYTVSSEVLLNSH